MGFRKRTWGVAWGDVEPPEGSREQAPFDAAFLAPFEQRPVLTASELFTLVRDKFSQRWEGVAAPIDVARVEQWKKDAVARGLVEEESGSYLRLTHRGEGRLKALQSGGLIWRGVCQGAGVIGRACGGGRHGGVRGRFPGRHELKCRLGRPGHGQAHMRGLVTSRPLFVAGLAI
jgi:hypothetical protein